MKEKIASNDIASTEKLKPIQIAFGDVYTTPYGTDRSVIIEVGKGKTCEIARIIDQNDQEAIGSFGTADRRDIKEIVYHWELERIIKAAMVLYKNSEPKGEPYDSLRKNSKQKPRTLKS